MDSLTSEGPSTPSSIQAKGRKTLSSEMASKKPKPPVSRSIRAFNWKRPSDASVMP